MEVGVCEERTRLAALSHKLGPFVETKAATISSSVENSVGDREQYARTVRPAEDRPDSPLG